MTIFIEIEIFANKNCVAALTRDMKLLKTSLSLVDLL